MPHPLLAPDAYQVARAKKRAARLEYAKSKLEHEGRFRPARMLVDTINGAVGYGRYRRRASRRFGGRRGRRVRGRGGYISDAYNWLKNKIPAGTAAAVGTGIGSFWGQPMLGAHWGQKFADYTGVGAYMPSAQVSDVSMDQGVPSIHNERGSDGAVVIQHKEYIQDVVSAGPGFNISFSESLNPGSRRICPWLSQVAVNFSQYKIEGMIFHFVSTSGALSTTQALGEIIMACNYNVGEAAYTTKQQMLSEVMAVSKVPSIDAELGIECDKHQNVLTQMYVRGDDGPPAGQDARFYDFGQVTIATQGQSAAVTLGELWVTYQVALYKPQLASMTPSNTGEFTVCQYYGAHVVGALISTFVTKVIVPGGDLDLWLPASNTFNDDFRGYITIVVNGTGVTQALIPTIAGTATIDATASSWICSTGLDYGVITIAVSALKGKTLTVTSNAAWTTCTGCQIHFNAM